MPKSVGLEIHPRGVRVAEVVGRGRKFRVTRYVDRPVTPRGGAPDPDELHDALAELFKSKFNRNHVIAGLDASETVVREIPVPFSGDDQIKKVVKYEAEHHLHDCDADDVVVQYVKVGAAGEGTNLLVMAARKDDIGRRIDYCRGADVEPLAMDLDALAFHNAASAAGLFEETPNCLLLHIGHRTTGMAFVVDGQLRTLRSVRLGVDSIAQGLARDMDIDITEADEKLTEIAGRHDEDGDLLIPSGDTGERADTEKSHSELERDLFHQKRDEFLSRLKREFARSSAALRGNSPERVVVAGDGILVPGLVELLAQRLGVEVEAFEPSEEFACKFGDLPKHQFDAGAAVAIGLAIKGIGYDPLGLDFRQEELQVANKFTLLKNALAVTVTLLFLGLLAFSFSAVMQRKQLSEKRFEPMLTQAFQSFSEVTRKYNALPENLVPVRERVQANDVEAAGPRHLAISRFAQKLRVMKKRMSKRIGDQEGIQPISSGLRTLNDIMSVIVKNHEKIEFIDVDRIKITQIHVSLALVIRDVAAAELLEGEIAKIKPLEGWVKEPSGTRPLPGTPYKKTTITFRKKR